MNVGPLEILFALVSLVACLAVPVLIALGFIVLFRKNRDLHNRVEALELEIRNKSG